MNFYNNRNTTTLQYSRSECSAGEKKWRKNLNYHEIKISSIIKMIEMVKIRKVIDKI